MKPDRTRRRQRGFSLIELLVVLLILTLVMGVVFGEIDLLQKRYRSEETKLDLSQEARQVMDMLVRDLNSAGFPSEAMFSPGVLITPQYNDGRVAAGIVLLSNSEIWFEGDLYGDGVVRSVRYALTPVNGGCPCQIRRSQVDKLSNVAPWDQATNFATLMGTVVNSGGAFNIAGNGFLPDGTPVANNVLYGAYMPDPVFTAFDAAGNPVPLPLDIRTAAGEAAIATIRTVRITMNVLAPTADMQTNLRPVMSLTGQARIKN